MREGDPSKSSIPADTSTQDESYSGIGGSRNVCFVFLDGNMMFLNYTYLVNGKYAPADNIVTLTFTSDTVVLEGIHLKELFFEFMNQVPRIVTCTDVRYNLLTDEKPVVNSIHIQQPNTDQ